MKAHLRAPATLEKLSVILLILLFIGLAHHAAIPQPQAYHLFADARPLCEMPNAIDVLTNLAFLLAGLAGLRYAKNAPYPQQASLHLFATGMVLTALGSAFYHWAPSDQTLLWDRLPMTLAFAGALGAIAAQRVQEAAAMRWQNAWLYLGMLSVGLWAVTGDLRLYVAAQVGGFILGLLWLCAGKQSPNALDLPWRWVWWGYAAAKLAEAGDAWLWQATQGLVAGHGLKHLLAAAGTIPLWMVLAKCERAVAPHSSP